MDAVMAFSCSATRPRRRCISSSRLECCVRSRVMFVDEWGIRCPCGARMANCRQSSIAVMEPRSKQIQKKSKDSIGRIAFLLGGEFLPYFDFVYGTEKYLPRCRNCSWVPGGSVYSASLPSFVTFSPYPGSLNRGYHGRLTPKICALVNKWRLRRNDLGAAAIGAIISKTHHDVAQKALARGGGG